MQGAAQTAANAETADKLVEMQKASHSTMRCSQGMGLRCFPRLHQWPAHRTGRSASHRETPTPHSGVQRGVRQ